MVSIDHDTTICVASQKKRRERLCITYFGLVGYEVALLKSVMESAPDLAADYELREPK